MLYTIEPATLQASLITVNFRTIDRLKRLLLTLKEHPPTCTHEMIVVENDSPDPTAEFLGREYPATRYRHAENRGFAAGNNRGMEIARGRYYVLLNPDIEVPAGAIDAWIEWMDAHPDVAISGPALIYPDGSSQGSAYRYHRLITPILRRTWLGNTAWGKRQLMQEYEYDATWLAQEPRDVDWLLGAALCLRREAAQVLGGLDEAYFLYFEDEDLCRRAKRLGMRVVYLPQITLTHVYGKLSRTTSWLDVFRKRVVREHMKSAIRYFARYALETKTTH